MRRIRPLPIVVAAEDPLESELRHFLTLCESPTRSWEEAAPALEALRAADRIVRQVAPLVSQGATV
jgi:hypothetical protein